MQRLAVAGIQVADLPLRHGDQRHLVNAVLPAPPAEVQTAAEHVRLVTDLAIERKDAPLGQGGRESQLLDDSYAVIGNKAQAQCNDQNRRNQ